MKKTGFFTLPALLFALVLSLPAAPAYAQGEGAPLAQTDILPVRAASEADVVIDESNPTHPPVRLTPDKTELIRLDRKASTVLVGNPGHLNILPEGPNSLVLIPRAPGATYFTVLDEANKIIMQRHVIVASPKEKYVRIRKSCGGASGKDCQPTQVYYCPDMCHEIMLNAQGELNPAEPDDRSSIIDAALEKWAAKNEQNAEDGGTANTEEASEDSSGDEDADEE
ncbi:MAG: pilus assembly protein N-terminal domain-containing protein [Alphaproteobacteria bacterium]